MCCKKLHGTPCCITLSKIEHPKKTEQQTIWLSIFCYHFYYINEFPPKICYSNGKNTTLVSEQEPPFTLFCNDGYLYYFDDSNLYAADKGKSRIVMEEVPDFEKIIDKHNTRSEHGVFYQADNGSAYFINKGTAKQIVISD